MSLTPEIRAQIEARLGPSNAKLDAERAALRTRAAQVVADVRDERERRLDAQFGAIVSDVIALDRGPEYRDWLQESHREPEATEASSLMRAIVALRVKTARLRMAELAQSTDPQALGETLALIRFVAEAEKAYPGVKRQADAEIERAQTDPEYREASERAQLTLAAVVSAARRAMP